MEWAFFLKVPPNERKLSRLKFVPETMVFRLLGMKLKAWRKKVWLKTYSV